MRISELARAGGVGVPTIKFYLREGLLPEGRRTSATQAQYDERHLERLRLIRALLVPGGLSIAQAREVITHLDQPSPVSHDLLGLAHGILNSPATPEVDVTAARDLIRSWGWQVHDKDSDTQVMLARALAAIQDAGLELPAGTVDHYAELMLELATDEVALVPQTSAAEALRFVVLGTVLVEPLLLALRRLAQVEASSRRFGATVPSGTITG